MDRAQIRAAIANVRDEVIGALNNGEITDAEYSQAVADLNHARRALAREGDGFAWTWTQAEEEAISA